jgi:hypothetical protein
MEVEELLPILVTTLNRVHINSILSPMSNSESVQGTIFLTSVRTYLFREQIQCRNIKSCQLCLPNEHLKTSDRASD